MKAQMLFAQGKGADCVVAFQKAQAAYHQIGCADMSYLMDRNILKIHLSMGNIKAFNALFYKIMEATKGSPLAPEAAHKGGTLLIKSNFHLLQKELDSALVFGQRAMLLHEKHKDWNPYIRTNNHLALVAYYQEDFVSMERYIDNAFKANKTYAREDHKSLQEMMKLYGALYYKTGNYEQALTKTMSGLEVALANMKSRDDTSFVASCYNNIGLFYIELGDIYKAEDYCHNALQLYKRMGKHFEAATTYLNLGEFFGRQGNWEQALSFYKQGIQSLEKSIGAPPHELDKSAIGMYNGVGDVATRLGRYLEASEALKKSLAIHQREDSKKDETFSVLALYHKSIEEYDKALDYYKKTLDISRKIYNDVHPRIATVFFELGQVEYKKNNIEQAQHYYDSAKVALGIPLYMDMVSYITNHIDELSDKSILLQVLDAQSRLLFKKGQLVQAYHTAKGAVLLLEKMRNSFKEEGSKLFMVQKMIPTYEFSIKLALDLHRKTKDKKYLENAFVLVEKSKAMLLLDALKAEEARNFGNVPKSLLDEEHFLMRERVRNEKLLFEAKAANNETAINTAQKELLKLKRSFEKLQTTLEKDYPKYHELKYSTRIASLSQVQESLDAKTALVEYFIGNEHLYIFAIYKDTVWATALEMGKEFSTLINVLRPTLTDIGMLAKNSENVYLLLAKSAREIYQKYLEPALEFNKKDDINRLIIIPDGMLNYVPFDVLMTEKPDYKKVNFKKLPYLIKRYNINYHYSSTLKLFSRKSTQTNGKILAMASSYDKTMFRNMRGLEDQHRKIRLSVGDLPGAKREVEYLGATFLGKYLYGNDANEEAFKYFTQKEPYTVLHLAMHGVVDAKQPNYSSLVMSYSGSKVEDDLLHAYELNLLDIHADLVVLSACETGFGKYERGEGVVSLGRGFMYAGAPALVMTLWPINDRATSVLISEFYDQLANGYCKDEAMRLAKIKYLENATELTAHPFFWASFVNLGDYEPISLQKPWTWWQILLCVVLGMGILAFVLRRRAK